MNKTPSILVDTGFEVDQNGALTEIVTPNVVAALNPPRKVTFNGTALNWILSTTAALQELSAPNVVSIGTLSDWHNLTNISLPSVTTLNGSNNTGTFKGLSNVTVFTLTNVTQILSSPTYASSYIDGGAFYGCSGVENIVLPSLRDMTAQKNNAAYISPFFNCTGLKTFTAPKLLTTSGNYDCFFGCTSLENVTLGSDGNPVTSLQSTTFNGLAQSGLTITIYTSGGAALSGAPWGATNATIVYEEA